MLYFDACFGLGIEPWDSQHTTGTQILRMIEQVKACKKDKGLVVVINCAYKHITETHGALVEAGCVDIQPVVWIKQGQNVAGDPGRLTPCCEFFTIGMLYGGSKNNLHRVLSKNPLERQNYFLLPPLTTYKRYPNKEIVNQHEKPIGVIKWFAERWCTPNSWICVVGAGAGGDVIGAARAGFNVVTVESDPKQVQFLSNHLQTTIFDKIKEEEKKAKALGVDVATLQDQDEDGCKSCGLMMPAAGSLHECATCGDKELICSAACGSLDDSGNFQCKAHQQAGKDEGGGDAAADGEADADAN